MTPTTALDTALALVGGRWKLRIIDQLHQHSVLRYGELKNQLAGITHKMLAQQLRELEADELLVRTAHAVMPPRVDYRLSEHGKMVLPIVQALQQFGANCQQHNSQQQAVLPPPSFPPPPQTIATPPPPQPKLTTFPLETIKSMVVPIGKLFELDTNGCIINPAKTEYISRPWEQAIADTVQACQQQYGQVLKAVFVRGSVARGNAIDYVSDLDIVVVVDDQRIDRNWRNNFVDKMLQNYPFMNGLEVFLLSVEQLFELPNMRFLLKTQCLCVYGEDYTQLLPNYRTGRDAFAHLPYLHKDIKHTKQEIPELLDDADGMYDLCSWIMRRMVRTGLELIGEEAAIFTRDLYPCYEHFARYYPARAADMYRALALAIFPTADAKVLSAVLNDLGIWLVSEIARRYPDAVVR